MYFIMIGANHLFSCFLAMCVSSLGNALQTYFKHKKMYCCHYFYPIDHGMIHYLGLGIRGGGGHYEVS